MLRFSTRENNYLPKSFYNLKADLPHLPKPPIHPGTGQPLSPSDLEPIFPKGMIAHEVSMEREVPIPARALEAFRQYRPTPLICATNLKAHLQTPAHIFYKYEGAGPTGSHKSNTAIVQAYLAAEEGVKCLSTETGAGQWGCALAHAGSMFGLEVKIFMVSSSFKSKPGRKTMAELFGASIVGSPSLLTETGRRFLALDRDHVGSLGIAISEAIEAAMMHPGTKYSLGSVLDAVLMHQSIIGQEAEVQMREFDREPEVVIGCVGGGSNFGGISFPFVRKNLKEGKKIRFIAVEPESCPTLTKGELRYDHGDTAGMTPLLHMHTLGKDFIPPPLHAGGLRYHGMAPLVSHLVEMGLVEPRAYGQDRVFQAARTFFITEGILPAPESSHAIAAAIDEALKAKEEGKETVILFNLSGHGLLDMGAYEKNGNGPMKQG
jgi:tryptophan synthase beta chain